MKSGTNSEQTPAILPRSHWKPLPVDSPPTGVLTFYHSSSASSVPTRAVDRLFDNKRDPNFETRTYGLFTDCNNRMRTACVRDHRRYLFLMTNWKGQRGVAGFLDLGFYANITINPNLATGVALRARRLHLVSPLLPYRGGGRYVGFSARNVSARGINGSGPLRGAALVDTETTVALVKALLKRPDRTPEYMTELRRLEDVNFERTGYRYPDVHRRDRFGRDDVRRYLF